MGRDTTKLKELSMSERPQGSVTGIFGILFRETGLFLEQAFQWGDQQGKQTAQWADQQSKQTAQWADQQSKQATQWLDQQSKQMNQWVDRQLTEDQKRRAGDTTVRRADAEARLLEQMRLAKQAGLDVDGILTKFRAEK
jgi:hypothetical protein